MPTIALATFTPERLIAYLADPETYDCFVDGELETHHAADDAVEAIGEHRIAMLPLVFATLPVAPLPIARLLLHAFASLEPRELAALPDEDLATMIEWVERIAEQPTDPSPHERLRLVFLREGRIGLRIALPWERAFARRLRAGELSDPEAFWTARLAHPIADERKRAMRRLVVVARDRVRFAAYLVTQLDDPSSSIQSEAASALAALPPNLSGETVRELVTALPQASRRVTIALLPALARHGEPAAGLAPFCLEVLRRVGHANWELHRAAARALFLLGEIDEPIRGELAACLESLATFGAPGPHVKQLMRAVGDRGALAAVIAEFRRVLADDDVTAIADICKALLFVPGGSIVPLVDGLLGQLARDRKYELVNALCDALGRSGDRRAVPALTRLSDSDSRYAAVSALAELGPVAHAAVPALERLRDRMRIEGRSMLSDVLRALDAIAPATT